MSTRLTISVAAPLCILIVIFSEEILSYFDEELSYGYEVLIILAIAQLLNSSTGAVSALLIMTGHSKVASKIVVFSSVVSVVFGFYFIPQYGIYFAAYMYFLNITILNFLSWLFAYTRLGVNTAKLI